MKSLKIPLLFIMVITFCLHANSAMSFTKDQRWNRAENDVVQALRIAADFKGHASTIFSAQYLSDVRFVAFAVDGQRAVILKRINDHNLWSSPTFVKGQFNRQDHVFVLKDSQIWDHENIISGNFDILNWTQPGFELLGSKPLEFHPDDAYNSSYNNKPVVAQDILNGRMFAPSQSSQLLEERIKSIFLKEQIPQIKKIITTQDLPVNKTQFDRRDAYVREEQIDVIDRSSPANMELIKQNFYKQSNQVVLANNLRAGNPQFQVQTIDIPKQHTNHAAVTKVTPKNLPLAYSKQKEFNYTIESGDTLSSLAKKYLGSESRWVEIYRINNEVIKNPNILYKGQKIIIPDSQDS